MDQQQVRFAASADRDTGRAFQDIHRQLQGIDPAAILIYCSSGHDVNLLGQLLQSTYQCPIAGCTTAGEISGALGYSSGSVVAVALASPSFIVSTHFLPDLTSFSQEKAMTLCAKIETGLSQTPENRFGLLLVDGMSSLEERLVGWLTPLLPGLPILGGSAGDDLRFAETRIFGAGRFCSNAASLTVIATQLPVSTFQSQHFEPCGPKLVITEADPARRRVFEINGHPAAREYARLIGLEPAQLDSRAFSMYPVMLKIGGNYHVRSIQRGNDDGSLTFYCAIDRGLVLSLGQGRDLLQTTADCLQNAAAQLGRPLLTLGCDCILRRLEIQERNLEAQMATLLSQYKVLGFSTYGEQYHGVHVNQTLTGVMIGEGP